MTEQTGNSKPNEAEGLAFPLSGNEKLIDSVRDWPTITRMSQSFTEGVGSMSSELEREALDYLYEMNEAGRIEYDDYRNLHDLISGAVEPAREMFPGTLAALDELTTLPRKGQER